jgi:AcrR family transcriptional regulator
MDTQTETTTEPRIPLSRERVLAAALALADREGIGSLTMRSLARELGVEAMSLYYHVANKEEVLDGMLDAVAGEINDVVSGIDPPSNQAEWKTVVRERILTARKVMLRHPWAPAVMETRTNMSPEVVRYFDSLLGLLRDGGFSYDLAHHALHALGSRALGFTQELFDPDDEGGGDEEANAMLEAMAEPVPTSGGARSPPAAGRPASARIGAGRA